MKRSTVIIGGLLLLAFALRVLSLSTQSVWWDEAFTWQTTSHGWDNLWHMLQTGDRNPPLYFVLTTVWGGVAGWSEFSLRFVSLACGLIGVAFLFALARRLFGLQAGVWTLGLAAVAPALVSYSQEARMYALFFALAAATLYFGVRSAEYGFADRRAQTVLLVTEALLLLTHYFAVPLVAALNLLVIGFFLRKRAPISDYARWLIGQLAAALPLIVWTLWVFATPGSLINAQESPPDLLSFLWQAGLLWLSGVRDLRGEGSSWLFPALLLLVIASVGAGRKNPVYARWLVAFGVISLGLAYAVTNALTSFHPRYLLPYVVPWYVLAGGALGGLFDDLKRLRVNRQRLSAVAGLAIGGVTAFLTIGLLNAGWQFALSPAAAKDDARGVAAYLKANARIDDVILVEANDYTLSYYDHGPAQTRMVTATTESDAFTQLSQAIGQSRRVWLPHWIVSTQDPREYWRFLFEQSGSLKDWISYHGYEVYRYEMPAALRQPTVEALPLRATGSLLRKWSGVEGQGADGALTFAVEWGRSADANEPLGISMRLKDARGVTVSSVDSRIGSSTDNSNPTGTAMSYYILPIPPGTPPLTYSLTVLPYIELRSLDDDLLGDIRLPRRLDSTDPYRTLSGYAWEGSAAGDVAIGLLLEALAVGDKSPNAQDSLDVTLRWHKTGPTVHVEPKLRLVQNGRVWAEAGSMLFEREYPIEQWAVSETVIDRLKIDYPPVRGPLELQIGLGDQWTTLTTLQLDESQMMFNPPSMQHVQSAQFGDFAELLGYDLKSDSLSSARHLDLTLYWRGTNTEPITMPYTVFTQILAPDGHLVAQHDAPPNPPTTAWVPGQIVADVHTLKVVDATYRGPATLIVGWYNSASVVRMPASTGGDFVALTTPVEVVAK